MAILEFCCLLVLIGILLYYYITGNHNYWAKRGIAFEAPVPLFGNYLDAVLSKRNQGQIVTDIYNKFKGEKVVGMFSFMKPALLIRDPELVHQVLVTHFNNFSSNSLLVHEDVDPVIGKNLFIQRGEKWKRTRQIMSPAFTMAKIKPTYETIRDVTKRFLLWLEKHPEGEVKYAMSLFTSEIVASWGMGIDGQSFSSPDPILPKFGRMIFDPNLVAALKFSLVTMSPTLCKMFRLKIVPDDVSEFFDTMLRNLIRERETSQTVRKDFLQYYIDLKKKRFELKTDSSCDISEDEIIVGLISFFVEGYETASIVSSFIFFHLAKNLEIQKKLRDEVDNLFDRYGEEPTLDAILDLPLLDRVLSETVRIQSSLNMWKECTRDIDLDLGEGKILHIEKGTEILVALYGMHNDPQYWDDPDIFNPNRFTEEAKAARSKLTYIPFGDGPRICLGMKMSSTMIKTLVAHIIRKFEVLPTEKTPKKYIQDPQHFMTIQLGGIYVRFEKRK